MNGIQFLLLAFCLTLIEVINTLLIGRAGWGDRNSGWLIAGIGFFYDLSICNCYILGNLAVFSWKSIRVGWMPPVK